MCNRPSLIKSCTFPGKVSSVWFLSWLLGHECYNPWNMLPDKSVLVFLRLWAMRCQFNGLHESGLGDIGITDIRSGVHQPDSDSLTHFWGKWYLGKWKMMGWRIAHLCIFDYWATHGMRQQLSWNQWLEWSYQWDLAMMDSTPKKSFTRYIRACKIMKSMLEIYTILIIFICNSPDWNEEEFWAISWHCVKLRFWTV